ncbi:hypothetical protein Golax_021879 [Gossypium laxum]|uniref:Uncharacterized protein n=2 Tax=Gossypium TaxID=3633 RepID=A0A7J9K482_9ROSI|nr:hypothetical protein [Gossypium laxum]MBA0841223.1 hypothetical protein [Gossypium armourianum]
MNSIDAGLKIKIPICIILNNSFLYTNCSFASYFLHPYTAASWVEGLFPRHFNNLAFGSRPTCFTSALPSYAGKHQRISLRELVLACQIDKMSRKDSQVIKNLTT